MQKESDHSTYLCAMMTQQRLSHLMMLHVHKNHTGDLDLVAVANDFIDGNDHFFDFEFITRTSLAITY